MADPMSSGLQLFLCEICQRPATEVCPGCLDSCYCSEYCRRHVIDKHALLCGMYSYFRDEARPSNDRYRAIYLPVDQELPCFVWLKFREKSNIHGTIHAPLSDELLKSELVGSEFRSICQLNTSSGLARRQGAIRGIPHSLVLQYSRASFMDGISRNKAMDKLVTESVGPGSLTSKHSYGPILVFAIQGRGKKVQVPVDITMADVAPLVSALINHDFRTTDADYHREIMTTPMHKPAMFRHAPFVLGVRINCYGDQIVNRRPVFESFEVSRYSKMFTNGVALPVPETIRMPLLMFALPHDPTWYADREWLASLARIPSPHTKRPSSNEWADALHYTTTPIPGIRSVFAPSRSSFVKFDPHGREEGIGSVVVVRADMEPLFVDHIEALWAFCHGRVKALLDRSAGVYGARYIIDNAILSREITKEKFENFYQTWRICRASNTTLRGPSPYDLENFETEALWGMPFVAERPTTPCETGSSGDDISLGMPFVADFPGAPSELNDFGDGALWDVPFLEHLEMPFLEQSLADSVNGSDILLPAASEGAP